MDAAADIEAIRALLSAYANRDGVPAPVSVLSLRRELTRRMMAPDTAQQIDLLRRIGDIESVGGGFYLPVSTHVVVFDEWGLLISGLPTQEIRRLYGIEITTPGSARVIQKLPSAALISRRSGLDWLGTPRTTREWTEILIRGARFADSYGWDTLEIYNVDRRVGPLGWISAGSNIEGLTGVYLSRNAIGVGPRSYYLLRFGRAGVDGMSELHLHGTEIRRLQFGVRARAAENFLFSMSHIDEHSVLLSAPFLPAEETKFLEAIGHVMPRSDGKGIQTNVPVFAQNVVAQCLLALGLIEAVISNV